MKAYFPVKFSGLAPNTVDETSCETAKHTQTMAAAKAAIPTSKDSLHEQEFKRITDTMSATTKRTILRTQETGKWLQTPQVTSMKLACL